MHMKYVGAPAGCQLAASWKGSGPHFNTQSTGAAERNGRQEQGEGSSPLTQQVPPCSGACPRGAPSSSSHAGCSHSWPSSAGRELPGGQARWLLLSYPKTHACNSATGQAQRASRSSSGHAGQSRGMMAQLPSKRGPGSCPGCSGERDRADCLTAAAANP